MTAELIKSNLNLYAVLQNLEDVVAWDPEMKAFTASWRISIQFSVWNGPQAHIVFENGGCRVGRGIIPAPTVKLFFLSPAHLNRMMAGKGNPIPLKGFTKLPFLAKDFATLTARLEHFLKPTEKLLADEFYLTMNTRLTMNTAVFAVPELAKLDPIARLAVGHMRNGPILMKILPEGPAVHVFFNNGAIEAGRGDVDKPMACMFMRNVQVANAFLNGKMDAFSAIAAGDVVIKGQTPMLDAMSLVLDRIPLYLS
ncbi:MAG: hypothetical protein ACOZF0_03880 [Thermodesulfobacteriota bacterium]